jgi:hypothetical protein
MERIARMIESSARIDRELAAGLGCTASLTSVQTRIDQGLASCESWLKAIRLATSRK